MSYDIRVKFRKSGDTVTLSQKHNIAGGTYAIGGTDTAEFNITFNYAKWFYKVWPKPTNNDEHDIGGKKADETTPFGQMFAGKDAGIRYLYEKPIDDVIKELDRGINMLHGEPDKDYWKPTEGNARQALFNLKVLCEMARFENPDADLTIDGD